MRFVIPLTIFGCWLLGLPGLFGGLVAGIVIDDVLRGPTGAP